MKWYVVKKRNGYKILCAANPPRSEGPVIGEAPTYAEASVIAKAMLNFDSDAPPRGNA